MTAHDRRDAAASLEAVFREEHGRLLAALARRYGDLDLAEEVTSDAIETALTRWPVDGVPPNPGAWLMTTARRKAVDRLRRDAALAARLARVWAETEQDAAAEADDGSADALPDERLQLFFTCAHPALAPEDRIALTLRFLAGLTTGEVARALLVPDQTMAKRLTRAKAKVHGARVPFRAPGPAELPGRLTGVLQVIYSIFTEGYAATTGARLQRIDLADEAIRLARILCRLLPYEREIAGLLGLMLLVHSRADARTDDEGLPLLVHEQDRSLWNHELIDEGERFAEVALTGGPPGPYGVQAAIAALHAEAPDADRTDWPQIVALYDVLHALDGSAITALNRAAAIAMRDGPAAGLRLISELEGEPRLRGYAPLHACKADLLERAGDIDAAVAEYTHAQRCAGTDPERTWFARRIDTLSDQVVQWVGLPSRPPG